jgi:TonB family protein
VQHNDARFLELLQRWQSGDFTRADEQELHALAASDDFRREAMEGFMSLPEAAHEERLAALRIRLKKRVGRGRRVALPQILAAAAVLILLLAAIFFFPKMNEKEIAPVAQTQVESAEKNLPPETVFQNETPENEGIAANTPSAKIAPPAAKDEAASASGLSAAAEEAPALADEAKVEDAQPAYTSAPPAAPAQSRALENTAGVRPQAKVKKAENADTVWHETDQKPDMAAEKKAAREALPTESAPANGWEAFSEYLRQNARLTAEARNRNVSGSVRIQFNINENGEPQSFVVLRSLGYGCDQEAIRLVQNWEWVRGQNPTVAVDVPFVR